MTALALVLSTAVFALIGRDRGGKPSRGPAGWVVDGHVRDGVFGVVADALFSGPRPGMHRTAVLLLPAQALYAFLVYAHLRTFEGSLAMQASDGVVSLIALVLTVWGLQLLSRPPTTTFARGPGGDGYSAELPRVPPLAPASVGSRTVTDA